MPLPSSGREIPAWAEQLRTIAPGLVDPALRRIRGDAHRRWDQRHGAGRRRGLGGAVRRFGKLPFAELFKPAVAYARDGFAVAPITARRWQDAQAFYPRFAEINRTFFPSGRAPLAGRCSAARTRPITLTAIAESQGEAFYRGSIAQKIAACSAAEGGAMTLDDLFRAPGRLGRNRWPSTTAEPGCTKSRPTARESRALIALGILRRSDLDRLSGRLRRQPTPADRSHEKRLRRGVAPCG